MSGHAIPSDHRPTRTRDYYRTVGRFIEAELATRGDSEYWSARARECQQPRTLELGAGTGRITRVLAPYCRQLVALDLSLDMLRRAQACLAAMTHVHLVAADMTEFSLDGAFDLILAANDPFAHLPTDEERTRTVALAAEHLLPGGLFVLDAVWLSAKTRRAAMHPGGWKRERQLPGSEGDAGTSVREVWELSAGGARGRIRYEYRERGRIVGRASFEPRFWSLEEIRQRLSAAGLRIRRVLGSYEEEPWDPDSSSALIVEAVKDA